MTYRVSLLPVTYKVSLLPPTYKNSFLPLTYKISLLPLTYKVFSHVFLQRWECYRHSTTICHVNRLVSAQDSQPLTTSTLSANYRRRLESITSLSASPSSTMKRRSTSCTHPAFQSTGEPGSWPYLHQPRDVYNSARSTWNSTGTATRSSWMERGATWKPIKVTKSHH